MSPPAAFGRSVWVAGFVGVLMVNAMRRDPENWAALKGEGAAYGKEILHPFWCLVTVMRQQAVITHADAHIDGEDVEDCRGKNRLP